MSIQPKTFKQDAIRPPEPTYLTVDEITAKLFAGMRYVWICGYDSANYGGSYYYEFYHINRNIYLVDVTNKEMMSKLRKVFPVIDAWQDNTLLKNTPWKIFTPDACLCIYVHKDILHNMTPKEKGRVPMNDLAWSIICRLNRKEVSFMYGAILGDIIGSPYEFDKGDKTKDFFLFSHKSRFTDDTVMTVAVADALMYAGKDADKEKVCSAVISSMQHWGRKYPRAGYGGKFREWLKDDNPTAYGSFGNGSAMRVSAAGWLYNSIERTREIARWTAEVTHNHIEGVKGAESVASAIYLARMGESKSFIKNYIEKEFNYNLSRSLDEIRPSYNMDVTCQGSVPEAIIAFLESTNFEDAARNAVSIGGDTDTIACIAGSIAEAYYGIETKYIKECQHYIPDEMKNVIRKFNKLIKSDVYGDESVIEAAIRRFSHNSSSDDLEVKKAIFSRLKNNGDLLLSQGAVKFLNEYIENKENFKTISLPAFTSLKEFTDWFVDLDADDWEGEEDTENLIVVHVSLKEVLEYIANASDGDDYIKLNQGMFYITPQIAKEILEEYEQSTRFQRNYKPVPTNIINKGEDIMFNEEKSKAYKKLVKESQDDYRNNPDKHKSGKVVLVAPDIEIDDINEKTNFMNKERSFCNEINLYTYWQGFNYAKNTPEITYLLVAQDWGNPFNLQSPFMQRIIKMNHGDESVKYYNEEDNTYITDKHLVELFAVLGYDIANKRYPELFFTNFCLGYRTGNESGDMSDKLMKNDMEYFKRLCDILEPKNILCLGKKTFACAYEALTRKDASDFKDFKDNFNEFIKNNTSFAVQCGTKESRIYPLAHCGNGGTLSRNKILKDGKWVYDESLPKGEPLFLQRKDWERIKEENQKS